MTNLLRAANIGKKTTLDKSAQRPVKAGEFQASITIKK